VASTNRQSGPGQCAGVSWGETLIRDGQKAASVVDLPAIMLPIEPAVAAAAPDQKVAVVFPGYLLPADSLQESVHE
jgi:hypothetical protein